MTSSAVGNATKSKIAKNSLLAYCLAACAKDDNGDQEKSGRCDRDNKSMDVDNESLVESDEEKEIGSKEAEEDETESADKKGNVEYEKGDSEIDDDDNDPTCEAKHCLVGELSKKVKEIPWVQCDKCDKWYHPFCVKLTDVDYNDEDFTCYCKDC